MLLSSNENGGLALLCSSLAQSPAGQSEALCEESHRYHPFKYMLSHCGWGYLTVKPHPSPPTLHHLNVNEMGEA